MSASVTAARPRAPSSTACSAVSSCSALRSLFTSCSSCDLQEDRAGCGDGCGEDPLLALASGSGMVARRGVASGSPCRLLPALGAETARSDGVGPALPLG